MATVQRRRSPKESNFIALHNGDEMKQKEFHLAYSRMPENHRFELIGGMVFEPSPVSYTHGTNHSVLNSLLSLYAAKTPGVEIADNATVVLGEDDEVQPDILLRVIEKCGGLSKISESDFVVGAPELVAELAYSSKAIDLNLKKRRYVLAGVPEYIVFCLRPLQLYWYNLKTGEQIRKDGDGILRSQIYPGLWIHVDAVLQGEQKKALLSLREGIASTEHKVFVRKLAKA